MSGPLASVDRALTCVVQGCAVDHAGEAVEVLAEQLVRPQLAGYGHAPARPDLLAQPGEMSDTPHVSRAEPHSYL